MSTAAEYEHKIARYSRNRLRSLWETIVRGETAKLGWDEGKAFEYLTLRAFQIEEADVRWPYSVEGVVEQIDGVIYTDGLACLIECKDQKRGVNVEPIAKMRNQLLRRPAGVIGLIFSREGFTEPAMTLARFTAPQTILLWNGKEIEFALERKYMRKGLLEKYRMAVEHGHPYYDIRVRGLL